MNEPTNQTNPAPPTPNVADDPEFKAFQMRKAAESAVSAWEKDEVMSNLLPFGLKEKILARPEIIANQLALEEVIGAAKEKFLAAQRTPPAAPAAPTAPTAPVPPAPDAAKQRNIGSMSVKEIAEAGKMSYERAATIKVYGTGRTPVNMS